MLVGPGEHNPYTSFLHCICRGPASLTPRPGPRIPRTEEVAEDHSSRATAIRRVDGGAPPPAASSFSSCGVACIPVNW